MTLVASVSGQRAFTVTQSVGIPDNACEEDDNGTGEPGTQFRIPINAAGLISDIDIAFHVTHTRRSDLQVGLSYERPLAGEIEPIVLANNHGGSADNYHVTFDMDAASTCGVVCADPGACNTAPGPSCRPDQSFDSSFFGLDTPGVVVVRVCDRVLGDQGTLDEVSVIITGRSLSLDVDGNGVADALTDGLLTLRHEFGFSGNVLILGAVAHDCTRCTAEEIESFLSYP